MPEYRLKRLPAVYSLIELQSGGPAITVEQIGRGRYAVAYQQLDSPETVWLAVSPEDHAKEILDDCPSNPHLPQLAKYGHIGDRAVYKTRYYSRLRAKDAAAWSQYRSLKASWDSISADYSHRPGYARNSWGHDAMRALAEHIGKEWPELGSALHAIADSAANYGPTWVFEFAPRNLAVDGLGRLILLDPIFDRDVIEAYWTERRKAAEARRYGSLYR